MNVLGRVVNIFKGHYILNGIQQEKGNAKIPDN